MMQLARSIWFHSWRYFILIVVIAGVTGLGLAIRDMAWGYHIGLPFPGDANNGYMWGVRAKEQGYFGVYEREGDFDDSEGLHLDYAPLRLGVMTLWANWVDNHYPGAPYDRRLPDIEFNKPVLMLNTTMEMLSSILSGVLVYHLIRWRLAVRSMWTGVWQAVVAGCTVWFNPTVICNAHTWPQWDVWPMPFFLLAVYLCIRKWWLPAGVLLGIGALLKGQMLLIAWTFPLWALFIGDWRGAIKIIVGIFTGIALVGLPWEISKINPEQSAPNFDLSSRIFYWPGIWITAASTIISIILPLVFWRRIGVLKSFYPALVLFVLTCGLFLTMHLGGSNLWLRYSFEVGMRHHPRFYLGHPANLAALLVGNYDWRIEEIDAIAISFPQALGGDVSIRSLLLAIYILLSLYCVTWAAIHHRRRDPRMILAIILPWILFYTVALQVHERYLFYGSACCALLLACGRGWYLLGWVFTILAFIPTIDTLFRVNGFDPAGLSMQRFDLWRFMAYLTDASFPGIAWMLLLACAIALLGIIPARRCTVHEEVTGVRG